MDVDLLHGTIQILREWAAETLRAVTRTMRRWARAMARLLETPPPERGVVFVGRQAWLAPQIGTGRPHQLTWWQPILGYG